MAKEKFFQEMKKLPNQITAIRFLIYPLLIYFAYTRNKLLFTIFFLISIISDLIDGIVARRLNICSNFGNNLDAYADELIFMSVVVILYLFDPEIVHQNIILISVIISILVISRLYSLIKFKGKFKLHTALGKWANFIMYPALILVIYFKEIQQWIIIPFGVFVIFEQIEELVIFITYKKPDNNLKSLFFPILNKQRKWINEESKQL